MRRWVGKVSITEYLAKHCCVQAIKALQEKFNETRASFAPKSRFTFKTARKNPSAVSLSDAAELAAQKRLYLSGCRSPGASSLSSSLSTTPNYLRTPPDEKKLDQPLLAPRLAEVDQPEPEHKDARTQSDESSDPLSGRHLYSSSSNVSLSHRESTHIILPPSVAHASAPCYITDLTKCVVDLTGPSSNGAPYAGLTIKTVRQSLLICGRVDGAVHITDVRNSTIVVSSKQFRMHECKDVDVYLSCWSRPIIEDSNGIRFAPVPDPYVSHVDANQLAE